jgi:hypothetical protein
MDKRVSNRTSIGCVTGQVHTGSGDLVIGSLTRGSESTKEAFLQALRQFQSELEAAKQKGLPGDVVLHTSEEIEAAAKEVELEDPTNDRIVSRLNRAKEILAASAGAASATALMASAVEKLVPFLDSALAHVPNLLGR